MSMLRFAKGGEIRGIDKRMRRLQCTFLIMRLVTIRVSCQVDKLWFDIDHAQGLLDESRLSIIALSTAPSAAV